MSDLLISHLDRLHGRTRQNAAYDLGRWLAWLDEHGIDALAVTTADIDRWIAHLADTGRAPITIRSQMSHIRRLYRWLWEDGILESDPTRRARLPARVPVRDRVWLGPGDLRILLRYAQGHPDRTAAAMLHLYALSGTRAGETRALNVTDLGTHEGRPMLRIVRGKGTGRDRIPLPEVTAGLLGEVIAGRTHGPIFTRRGERIDKDSARHRTRRVIAGAGVPMVTPQGLRCGFITNALALGVPEREVMIAAGHATSAQTARYDRLRDSVDCSAGIRLAESVLG